MKKTICLMLALLMLSTCLAACNRQNASSKSSVSSVASVPPVSSQITPSLPSSASSGIGMTGRMAEIAEEIKEEVELPMVVDADDQGLKDVLGLDLADVDEYLGLYSLVNTKAMDIWVIKPAEGQTETVKTALEDQKARQESAFKDYLADQYTAVQDAEVDEIEGYLVLIILAEDADKVRDIIETNLKK